jgi:hypothetical protein
LDDWLRERFFRHGGNVDLLRFSGERFCSYPASLSNCTGLT